MSEGIRPADVGVQDEGSIVILIPLTDAGMSWMNEYLPADAQRFGKGWVVEPRFVSGVLTGMVGDGLTLGKV
jgi:hypothetical protein